MKIKRFVDKDSRGAMAQVRSALGPEAVILSNKRVGDQIEMVAAIDLDEIAQLADKSAGHAAPSPPNLALVNNEPTLSGLQRELGDLRSMVERGVDETLGEQSVQSDAGELRQRLLAFGLPPAFIDDLVSMLPATGCTEDAWALAQEAMREQLPVLPLDSLVDGGGLLALRGTAGCGKTTTLAKLAARFVLRHGKEKIALVTTDCYRVGGQEQLQAFAQYLEVPLFVATDARELRMTLDQLQHKRLVLIDMPGLSQRNLEAVRAQDEMLGGSGYPIESCVVLPATSSGRVLDETVRAFAHGACAAVVVKQDEAEEPGAALGALMTHRLPLAYVGTGQKVPQDLVPATADFFFNQVPESTDQQTASLSQTLQDSLAASVTRVRT